MKSGNRQGDGKPGRLCQFRRACRLACVVAWGGLAAACGRDGEDFDAFMALDLPNILSLKNKKEVTNVCKYALYSDLFNNFMDRSLPEDGGKLYAGIKSKLRRLGKTSNYKYIFHKSFSISKRLGKLRCN